jgi:hypothetical protein
MDHDALLVLPDDDGGERRSWSSKSGQYLSFKKDEHATHEMRDRNCRAFGALVALEAIAIIRTWGWCLRDGAIKVAIEAAIEIVGYTSMLLASVGELI